MIGSPLPSRFVPDRRLGAGGFGEVWSAYDRERDARVALKRLTHAEPATLYRFKHEFRALADVVHPNLVRLHELFSAGDEWYLAMDVVEGVDFRAWLRGGVSALADTWDEPVAGAAPDADRVREALRQLVAGVRALHEAGKLHRDLKPPNVLVDAQGRVVILDFGLVAELDDGRHRSIDPRIQGTPAYMAPEQARGGPVTPAADWYAVGVMLYEVLRGRLPFGGTLADMLLHKETRDPPDPRQAMPGLPADLCDLAMALLRRDPAARPDGDEIARRLGDAAPAPAPRAEIAPFVGRQGQLAALAEAFATARAGRPLIVHVRGASGMGKTALVRRFLDGLEGAVVLEGRCFERESVPYKAFDGLVDALTDHLRRLPPLDAPRVMPRDLAALARLFPVLGRLEAVAGHGGRPAPQDPRELRKRAFGALRELLARLADRQPLVLAVDDAQWGDSDSAALLAELFAPPDPPAVLLVMSWRVEDEPTSELLRALRPGLRRGREVREVEVGPLPPGEATALAASLLGALPADAQAIARESEGNPLFVHELARFVAGGRGPRPASLQGMLAERIAALPDAARRLLEVVAVAGRPFASDLARRAAGLDGAAEQAARTELRLGHLVRTTTSAGRLHVETLHDAVRHAATGALDGAGLRACHGRVAAALEADPAADPEALADHFAAAGEAERARRYAEIAADRAADALAFDRAAALYRAALGPANERALRVKLADALAHAGRGLEAARTYLDAVDGAGRDEVLDLRRRAAEQLLRSGHVDEGLSVMRTVLDAVGLAPPRRPSIAVAALWLHRTRLRRRGFDFAERDAADVPPLDLARMDVCWSLGNGLGGVDLVRGAEFHARHMLLALAAGEPYRIARALAWEAILSALEGAEGAKRAEDLSARAEALAQRIAHPHALAWAIAAAAVWHFCEGRWRLAHGLCDYGTALFREQCADIAWEVGSLAVWWNLPALFHLGEVGELARRAEAVAQEAEARGDRYALTSLRTFVQPLVHLAADRPDDARRDAAGAIAGWSVGGWHMQHWSDLLAQCQADLYTGEARRALDRLARHWSSVQGAQQHRNRIVRVLGWDLRARCALAAGQPGLAAEDARRLAREGSPWADALAGALRAGLRADAVGFDRAAAGFDGLEMRLHAEAARARARELRGEEATEPLRALAALGIADPRRFARLLVPAAH